MNRFIQNFIYRLLNDRFVLIALATVFILGMIFTTYVFNVSDVQAVHTCSTGFQVGSSSKTIDCHGVCKKVSSSTGTIFVGTKTSGEWGSFRSNPSPGASISNCAAGTKGHYGLCHCNDVDPVTGFPADYSAFDICGVVGADCSWACNFNETPPADGFIIFNTGCSSACNNSGCS